MTYKTLELEGDQHFANGDWEQALGCYKSAIRMTDDPSVMSRITDKRIRAAERAYPSKWAQFKQKLGVSW